ncbi:MAG: carboxynorspermidine decarboxylase [Lachnospiraceae bacterium]|nr:carboxynorspermidine decarboxylase [Lachnospiraceae bacterium]
MKFEEITTPSYVIDEKKLRENLELLSDVQKKSGCKILLAQKAFSAFCEYPMIGRYLAGATASGLYEAKLSNEEMGKENHIFSPAYRKSEIEEIASICDHVIFNSFSQLAKYADTVKGIQEKRGITDGIGLRINPECSTQDEPVYDPCAPGSRLGITLENFRKGVKEYSREFSLVSGIHFHTLCEQGFEPLKETYDAVEKNFGEYIDLPQIKWLNMGGGHHITKPDYDREGLIELIRNIKYTYRKSCNDSYNNIGSIDIYLEPGEAVALNAGYLVTEVMDIVENDIRILVLDASAACHMPDVLEMPYRPPLMDSGLAGEKKYTYRLSSCTCLAGDIIGDYSFDHEINVEDRLVFEDMAIYSMVKNNTFNGIGLPSIYAMDESGECRLVKKFGYEDFKMRLS